MVSSGSVSHGHDHQVEVRDGREQGHPPLGNPRRPAASGRQRGERQTTIKFAFNLDLGSPDSRTRLEREREGKGGGLAFYGRSNFLHLPNRKQIALRLRERVRYGMGVGFGFGAPGRSRSRVAFIDGR